MNKYEELAKEWDDKLPNLAKALRNKELQGQLEEIKKLTWVTKIQERKLIIYVLESSLLDEDFRIDYKIALRDEIENHKLAIEEYEEELNKLKNHNP